MSVQVLTKLLFDEESLINVSVVLIVVVRTLLSGLLIFCDVAISHN